MNNSVIKSTFWVFVTIKERIDGIRTDHVEDILFYWNEQKSKFIFPDDANCRQTSWFYPNLYLQLEFPEPNEFPAWIYLKSIRYLSERTNPCMNWQYGRGSVFLFHYPTEEQKGWFREIEEHETLYLNYGFI